MEINKLNLSGRVALVTGGSRGIGRSVVELLAEAGVHVSVNYVSDEKAAKRAVEAAMLHGVEAIAVKGDVALLDEAAQVVKHTTERFGRIDILVCNAGVWRGAAVEEINEDLWDQVIDANLKGTWTVCRATVPLMKQQGGGRIVIVSSTAGQRGEAYVSNYAASKGGQISFAKSLATELGPAGINVNVVAPGWVDTEMNQQVFAQPGFRQQVESAVPIGRIASAKDVALPILFLCSDWARHITGEVLNVNGGSVLCG